jgi:hypothetical protein
MGIHKKTIDALKDNEDYLTRGFAVNHPFNYLGVKRK